MADNNSSVAASGQYEWLTRHLESRWLHLKQLMKNEDPVNSTVETSVRPTLSPPSGCRDLCNSTDSGVEPWDEHDTNGSLSLPPIRRLPASGKLPAQMHASAHTSAHGYAAIGVWVWTRLMNSPLKEAEPLGRLLNSWLVGWDKLVGVLGHCVIDIG